MAASGKVQKLKFDQVVEAVCEPLGSWSAGFDRNYAGPIIREDLAKQIVEISMEDDGSRQSYHRAMRMAENTANIFDAEPRPTGGLVPSLGLLIFLRRLTRGLREIEFSGSERLALAAPGLRSEGSPRFQLHDLTSLGSDAVAEQMANMLARRNDDGSSVLLASGDSGSEVVKHSRRLIGLSYALEIVAEISSLVATGIHGGNPITAFVVGERRPEIAESLRKPHCEHSRSLAEAISTNCSAKSCVRVPGSAIGHLGIEEQVAEAAEDRENNDRQRPYSPLSNLTAPFTMIAKSLEGATAKALLRVAREF